MAPRSQVERRVHELHPGSDQCFRRVHSGAHPARAGFRRRRSLVHDARHARGPVDDARRVDGPVHVCDPKPARPFSHPRGIPVANLDSACPGWQLSHLPGHQASLGQATADRPGRGAAARRQARHPLRLPGDPD